MATSANGGWPEQLLRFLVAAGFNPENITGEVKRSFQNESEHLKRALDEAAERLGLRRMFND